jgi:hypothetical protein
MPSEERIETAFATIRRALLTIALHPQPFRGASNSSRATRR